MYNNITNDNILKIKLPNMNHLTKNYSKKKERGRRTTIIMNRYLKDSSLPPAAPFATAAQFRAIPRAGRAASVARPRDAPASRPGGRAPLPFGRGKAHPGDRKGHARLVALTDHALDGRSSRTTTRWRTRTSRSCRPAAARGGHGQRRVLQNGGGRLP